MAYTMARALPDSSGSLSSEFEKLVRFLYFVFLSSDTNVIKLIKHVKILNHVLVDVTLFQSYTCTLLYIVKIGCRTYFEF